MSRPEGVPAEAERIATADYLKGYETPSKLLPGVKQRQYRLHCPSCSKPAPPEWCCTRVCECGLSMHLQADLYIWREKETADARV